MPFVENMPGFFVFAVIYGLDWFATVPPSMAITADTFGRENVGKVYGWIFMSHQIGAAVMAQAPALFEPGWVTINSPFFPEESSR